MVFFQHVPLAPPDPILGLTQAFLKDSRPNKVNLGVGLYKDEQLKTPVLASVRKAERLLGEQEQNKEYLPIDGLDAYLEGLGVVVFGESTWKAAKERIAPFQTLGGTGALRLGGTFLKEEVKGALFIPSPSWPNHQGVFSHCGFSVETYPCYDFAEKKVDFDGLFSSLKAAPARSTILLHACCHNPSGMDLTRSQWQELGALFKSKQLLAFFDLAYQGLGQGLDEDAFALRHFLKEGIEMLVAVSNSKNFSLYSERVGALFIVSEQAACKEKLVSRVKQFIRTSYSNPPSHGAKTAALILNDPILCASWKEELAHMRQRLVSTRALFVECLRKQKTKNDFSYCLLGQGMFGLLPFTPKQVHVLISEWGIYLTSDGRISLCGLNSDNVETVAKAIRSVDA